MTDSSQPIAGWYPDPENAAAERWWDGAAWSDHRRPSTVAPAAPATPSAPEVPVPPAAPTDGSVAPGAMPSGPAPAAEPASSASASPYPAAAPAAPAQPAYGAYATPPAAPDYNPYGAPAYRPSAPSNSLALVGLILACGSIIVGGILASIAGGIVSIIGLNRANQMRARGEQGDRRGMAIAGIIVGFGLTLVWIVVIIAVIAFSISQSGSTSYGSSSF
ncbi:DUF2510 domain-containing protein [Pseudolysinimonas sp.]|uniref:DUF2510 domain-containing protein n=1 Tax=Pseudolysinimonas sp. TaxID=2680009 RepID=UPI003F7FE9E0